MNAGNKVLDAMDSRAALAAYRVVVGVLLTVGTLFLNDIRNNQRELTTALGTLNRDGAATAGRVTELEKREDVTGPLAQTNRIELAAIKAIMRERGGIRIP